MNTKKVAIAVIVVLTSLALSPEGSGQTLAAAAAGQIPTMPRLFDPGLGNWAYLGLGVSGFVLAFSRLSEHTVVTARAGLYVWPEALSGADMAVTVGLPLSRGRFFASVGAGLSCLAGKIEPYERIKAFPGLAADLQMSFRLTSKLALGVYVPAGIGLHKVVGGFFACVQYGRFEK